MGQAGAVSKTVPARYHGFEFWVYDVCASILFAQMADVIAETPRSRRPGWLTELKQQLRVHAVPRRPGARGRWLSARRQLAGRCGGFPARACTGTADPSGGPPRRCAAAQEAAAKPIQPVPRCSSSSSGMPPKIATSCGHQSPQPANFWNSASKAQL